jgi:diacylglycerol kinase (ATP)
VKICVIFNPAARGDKARQFRARLDALAGDCALKPSTHPGAAHALAAEAVNEKFDVVVAAGGDGTVNEVLNGIAAVPGGLARVQFGVLPLGTVNVFAKELRIPADFDGAWSVIQQGKELAIDAPYGAYTDGGKPARRYFAQFAGAGLDSRAIALVDWELKKRVGYLAYVVAGFKALGEKLPDIVVSDGKKTARGKLALIGNGRYYGGKFNIFPLAEFSDGMLEVTVFPTLTPQALARIGLGMISNDFHTWSNTVHLQGSSIEVVCEAEVPFHVDGENVAPLPATFSVESRALRVLAP